MEQAEAILSLERISHLRRGKNERFQELVLAYYREHGRSYPWRETRDPYAIVVSEFMLQQTQTDRVVPKYKAFLDVFPDWETLAEASTTEVLKAWEGLGYYRRARNLQRAARAVCDDFAGNLPRTAQELVELPGIGPYTAAAVAVFAFGAKTPMIETNIRSVYLYTFFRGIEQVSDKTLLEVIAHTMYTKDTRAWFYALMDIGVALKKTARGINKQSKHYSAQTPYEGSVRQVRAAVLRFLTSKPASNFESIRNAIAFDQEKLCRAIESLIKDGFLVCEGRDSYSIV